MTLDEVGRDRWLSFISSRRSTVYHHPAWHAAIELSYGIRPVYVVMTDSSGALRAALPGAVVRGVAGTARFVSYPFSDTCGPVADDAEDFGLLAAAVAGMGGMPGRRWRCAEVRTEGQAGHGGYSSYRGYRAHILRTDRPADELYAGLHRDCVQRRVKKAFRSGLEVREGASLDDMRSFYSLHLMTRKRLGAPVQPFSFFRCLWNEMRAEGLISVLLVYRGRAAVAGVVLLRHGARMTYKFGASDERCSSLGANQLAMWSAIRKASHEGIREFDFGRSLAAKGSLGAYKARYGAREVELNYQHFPPRQARAHDEGGRLAGVASAVFRSIPAFSSRLIGRLIYKYLA